MASAQVGSLPNAPPRDGRPAPPAPAGTGSIRGRIVDAQSGLPVARAHVRLLPLGGGSAPAQVTTDDTGTFSFQTLAAGSYIVDVDRTSYLHARYPEPGKTVRTSNRRLTISDGEAAPAITLPLYRGSVIAGRVVDPNGDPLEYATVQLLALPASGRGRPAQRGGAQTNDIGEFRIAHLEPGRYVLLVVPRNNGARETYVGMSAGRPFNASDQPSEPQPLPTYYPGVPSLGQAQPLTIRRGESSVGLEMAIIESAAAWVRGTVVDTSGAPVGCCGGIQIRPIQSEVPFFGGSGTAIRPDGTFVTSLAPGEYELTATLTPRGVEGPPPPNSQRFGRTTISVGGDLSDVSLVVAPPARISGKLVLDGTSPLPDVTSNPNRPLVVFAGQNDGEICRSGRFDLRPDLTFTIDGIFGTCTPRASGIVSGWTVKSVQYGGKEMLDQRMAFEPSQDLRDVRVVLSDKHTELAVEVNDDGGAPTSDFVALVFSTDRAKWTEGSSSVRLVPGAVPSSSPPRSAASPFASPAAAAVPPQPRKIMNLPDGDYYVVAIDDIATDGWRDAALLEKMVSAATHVTLVDGSPVAISVRRMKLADLVPER